jgi:hypothetical protein
MRGAESDAPRPTVIGARRGFEQGRVDAVQCTPTEQRRLSNVIPFPPIAAMRSRRGEILAALGPLRGRIKPRQRLLESELGSLDAWLAERREVSR